MSKLLEQSEKNMLFTYLCNKKYTQDEETVLQEKLNNIVNIALEESIYKIIGKKEFDYFKKLSKNIINKTSYFTLIDFDDEEFGLPRWSKKNKICLYPEERFNCGIINRSKILLIDKVRATTAVNFPLIGFINIFNKDIKNYKDLVNQSYWVSILEAFTELFEFRSLKLNYLSNYLDNNNNFLPKIKTEESLQINYPEIYKDYIEFKKEEETKFLEKSEIDWTKDIKELLEKTRDLLKLVDEEKEEEGK